MMYIRSKMRKDGHLKNEPDVELSKDWTWISLFNSKKESILF